MIEWSPNCLGETREDDTAFENGAWVFSHIVNVLGYCLQPTSIQPSFYYGF